MSEHQVPVLDFPVGEKTSYKDFVRTYLGQVSKTDYPSAKMRLAMAAAAWRRLDAEKRLLSSGSLKRKGDAGTSKAKTGGSTIPQVKRWADLGGLLRSGGPAHSTVAATPASGGSLPGDGHDGHDETAKTEPAKLRRGKIVVMRTKANQRHLNNVARSFQKEVAAGKIMSANDAFLAGLNAWATLAGHS